LGSGAAFAQYLLLPLALTRTFSLPPLFAGLLVALLGLGAAGCASDKSLVSHKLNNVAARDNGYFLAREKLRETETALYKGRLNDYNRVLPLFPTLDSGTVRATRPDLNDIIKKASLPIQHRPGSDWTDDAYILVGWSRFYKMEFDDAVLTFKYVNSTSKDPYAKQEALIGLMRSFLVLKQLDNAKAVSDLLDKETGLRKDARELFLTRAAYFLQVNEPKQAIVQLERAVPLIPLKNERSRTRYILAQLYQEQGQDKEASAQLNEILKRNPPYELDFFAKLMLGQVSELGAKDKARLDKYYAKLLKDLKNKEYRDKIYYEMARVAYRQQKYADALKLLQTSAKATTTNRSQKGYTYLLAGRIYYENLQKYRLAAAYYDSTTQALPKENPTYAAVQERADILKEFAKQYTIIETQDSLQALVKLPAAELDQRLSQYALAEIEAKRKAAEVALAAQKAQQQRAQAQAQGAPGAPSALTGNQRDISNPNTFDPTNAVASGALWYFDNPTALGTARTDFIRKWGDRGLRDNWRTVNTPSNSPNTQQNGGVPPSITGNGTTQVNGTAGQPGDTPAAPNPAAEQQALVASYRAALPSSPDKLLASNVQVEAAMYELGGIYKELLKEPARGYETYSKQVARYPHGANAPEAYYLLYLYYKGLPDAEKTALYAAALQREFPTSTYAKLIADPLYREHELALNKEVAVHLDSAFVLYKDQYFTKAKAVLIRTERAYPKSDLSDRMAYLRTLLAIRTLPALTARAAVVQFYQEYPSSPLVPRAQELAASYKKAEDGQLAGALASTDKPVVSIFRPGEVNNRLRIQEEDDLPPRLDAPAAPATSALTVPSTSLSELKPATTPVDMAPQPVAPVEKPANSSRKPVRGGKKPAASSGAPAGGQPALANGAAAPTATTTTPAGSSPAPAPTTGAAVGTPPATAPDPAPAAPAVAYTTQLSAAHAVVLIYPKGTAPTADLAAQLTTYNGKFFRANNLVVLPAEPLGATQEMVVVRTLPGAKVAQSYATKLRGPQSPLARLRGQGYQAVVISLSNLTLLQGAGDVAGYQQFYQQVYQ
jgi:tetratricopeptide (TPR) repeat protein